MQLTRGADYAVRLMIHFAAVAPPKRMTRDALAQATGLPESFVAKILQSLTRAGLVTSRRGLDGGFALGVDPRNISLVDIIEAIDGPIALNVCLVTGAGCEQQVWCGAHRVWAQAQAAMLKVLRSRSLAELAAETAARKRAVEGTSVRSEDGVLERVM
jgi:Rrf2 family transcriptional regulator, iron-sulfur cluster assembly transcription factor